jgi:hypothetical protein
MKNNTLIIIGVILLAAVALFAATNNDRNSYRVNVSNQPVTETQKQEDATPQTPVQNPTQNPAVSTAADVKFEGTISKVDTGCFADGICSVVIDGKTVILVTGGRLMANQTVGSLQGVPSIGDLEQKIGARAEVYAKKVSATEYTLYGNSSYYVKVK